MSAAPRIEDVLAQISASPDPKPPPWVLRTLQDGATEHRGKIVVLGPTKAVASFPTVSDAAQFRVEARERGFMVSRVGAEIRIERRKGQ